MLLINKWSGLGALPRIPLVPAITPVDHLAEVSARAGLAVYAKRDDATAPRYGGNKVRKLEWLLGDAQRKGARSIVTVGGTGSHHCLATAIYGTRAGFDVHAVVFPQPPTPHVSEVARAMVAAGADVTEARTAAGIPLAVAKKVARLKVGGAKPYVIGPGGSTPVGTLGYVAAGVELAQQIDEGEVPEPGAVFVAAGSGGTVAGLAIGLAAAGVVAPVIAVRVTGALAINRRGLSRLVHQTVSLIRSHDDRFPIVAEEASQAIVISSEHRGPAYGASTGAGQHALSLAARDGLGLDPTYTAKAFAALLDAARDGSREGPLLFLSTLSSAPMAPLL